MKWPSIYMKSVVEKSDRSLSSVLTVENFFSRKATLQNHQQHVHQVGGAINNDKKGTKRKLEEDQSPTLPKKMKDIPEADRGDSAMKGAKVDAFFHPKTDGQKADQQVFFKETLPRLEAHLKKALQEKKAITWN